MKIKDFVHEHFKHFNAAALVDAAKAYEKHLKEGKKMLVSLAGAMSTAELGKSLAEMIRQDKIHIISCTGANLEEDLMNLVAHKHYKRVPTLQRFNSKEEKALLDKGLNRVTDTCIPEEEAFRRLQGHVMNFGKLLKINGESFCPMNLCISYSVRCFRTILSNTTRKQLDDGCCQKEPPYSSSRMGRFYFRKYFCFLLH